jgi:hypothetical protein
MLSDDAGLELVDHGRSEYVGKEELWARSQTRAADAEPIDRFLASDDD